MRLGQGQLLVVNPTSALKLLYSTHPINVWVLNFFIFDSCFENQRPQTAIL